MQITLEVNEEDRTLLYLALNWIASDCERKLGAVARNKILQFADQLSTVIPAIPTQTVLRVLKNHYLDIEHLLNTTHGAEMDIANEQLQAQTVAIAKDLGLPLEITFEERARFHHDRIPSEEDQQEVERCLAGLAANS